MNLHPHAVHWLLWMWYSAAPLYRRKGVNWAELAAEPEISIHQLSRFMRYDYQNIVFGRTGIVLISNSC
mgnify:CR=1 FL=1